MSIKVWRLHWVVAAGFIILTGCDNQTDKKTSSNNYGAIFTRLTPPLNLGVEISKLEAEQANITIDASGNNLPPGSGTAAKGALIYAEQCASCHGPNGEGRSAQELVGGILNDPEGPTLTIGSYWPYAPPLFDYIRRSMPPEYPFSLADDQVYALTAFLLAANGIINQEQTINAKSLRLIKMPNRDGFKPIDVRISSSR